MKIGGAEMSFLVNKRILLAITGSIAAYKSPDLVRRLREVGALVRVVMTQNAKQFITSLTLQAVSGFPVHSDLFDEQAEAAMGHIELARWADLILVAPASADFIARLAGGQADDLLTTLCLATDAPIVLAPAMNQKMWQHSFTQANIKALCAKHITLLGTNEGSQACGDVGPGRMLEPMQIIEKVSEVFASDLLAGCRILVNAGPTHEALDPVRFITNHSSGMMGYELARCAREAGASVELISGPVNLPVPTGVLLEKVVSAREMYDAIMRKIHEYDIFLAVAAVGDYHCREIAVEKIHKSDKTFLLQLEPNPDIVATVGKLSKRPFIVGFAAETENLAQQAKAKLERKKMDMIVANVVGPGKGMGNDENEVLVITKEKSLHLPLKPKPKLARDLIAIIADEFKKRQT